MNRLEYIRKTYNQNVRRGAVVRVKYIGETHIGRITSGTDSGRVRVKIDKYPRGRPAIYHPADLVFLDPITLTPLSKDKS